MATSLIDPYPKKLEPIREGVSPRCPKCDVPLASTAIPFAGMLWLCDACGDVYEGQWVMAWDQPMARGDV